MRCDFKKKSPNKQARQGIFKKLVIRFASILIVCEQNLNVL